MRLTKLDDYQSWLVSAEDAHVAFDPWLTDRYAVSAGAWLLSRTRGPAAFTPVEELPRLTAIIITAPFADHLHPSSLALLPRDTMIFAARKAAAKLGGFPRVTVLTPGVAHAVGPFSLRAIPSAFPFSRSTVGVLLEAAGKRMYLEPHRATVRHLRGLRVDAVVLPRQRVDLFGLPLAMPASESIAIARALEARFFLPSGLDPQSNHGVLNRLLSIGNAGSDTSIVRTLKKGEHCEL